MENNFFNQVGKKMPYTTPEDFFNRSEKELRSIVHRKSFNRKWYYGIAASIVLAIGIFGIVRFSSPKATQVEASFYSQTYDNSADWSDFADADIFLDNID